MAGSATWNLNPTDDNWNNSANWTPTTVPNGPADVATFDATNNPNVNLNTDTEANALVFNPGASAYTITLPGSLETLTLSGVGVSNGSALNQTFNPGGGEIDFENAAEAGIGTVFSYEAGTVAFFNTATAGSASFLHHGSNAAGAVATAEFHDQSSADQANFTLEGSLGFPGSGGRVTFSGSATAGTATFTTFGGVGNAANAGDGGGVNFTDSSTAGDAVFTNDGSVPGFGSTGFTAFGGSSRGGNAQITNKPASSADLFASGGQLLVSDSSTLDRVTVTNEGGAVDGGRGGLASFLGGDAGNAVFNIEGAQVGGALGAAVVFAAGNAARATFTLSGGADPTDPDGAGTLYFQNDSDGAAARIQLEGGRLDVSFHSNTTVPTVGSVEGDGTIELGSIGLMVGSNNLSTTFSGMINGTTLVKIGTGKLTLTGANQYGRSTHVLGGQLIVNNRHGSGTGLGPVKVNAGILAGRGTISGAVTIGTGSGPSATLSPGTRPKNTLPLTIQSSLTFQSNATFDCDVNSLRVKADMVLASGPTINGGAQIALVDNGGGALPIGTSFTVISNTSAGAIAGSFSNLPDGSIISAGSNNFQASYAGGDGNDLTLTVVP